MFRALFSIILMVSPLILEAQPDSTKLASIDTNVTQPLTSQLYWYDITNKLHTPGDSTRYVIFHEGDEKDLNYTNPGDLFRENALWFYYNLSETGRPAYLSPIQLFPHQSALFYDGVVMNNPVHGMFNMQFLSVSHTQTVETSEQLGGIQSLGFSGGGRIQFTPLSVHKDDPWTRIVYKQGAFGYSMVDISFAKSFSNKVSLQLGGFNNLYDGTLITANFKGTNFRGNLTWQYSEDLYFHGKFYLDRHQVGLAQYELVNEVVLPNLIEKRDDYSLGMTWFPDTSHHHRLHAVVFGTYYFRELRDQNNKNYYLEYEDVRYGLDANYNLDINYFTLLVGGGAQYTRVWGIPFSQTYYPSVGNVYGTLDIPLLNYINVSASVNTTIQEDYSPQISGFAALDFNITEEQFFSVSAGRFIRFPNAGERFFDFDTLFGNPDLNPEEHFQLNAEYVLGTKPNYNLKLNAGLHRINSEVIWEEPYFSNAVDARDFAYTGLSFGWHIWKFNLFAGGQYSFADRFITSRSSAWGKIHFHHILLDGALMFDLYGMAHFFDIHNDIFYDPRMDRFFSGDEITDAYSVLNWKAVATIKEARIFFEMDNALSENYTVVKGYNELYIRWRFGINWILWN